MTASAEQYPYNPPAPQFVESDPYELAIRSQADGEEIVRGLGALEQIRDAVLGHCEEYRPAAQYKPELLKARLKEKGWISEVRVPPFSPEHDNLPINERYGMLKFFKTSDVEVGVAIEMDNWMVHRDLLKFRRGFERGQIAAGVIIQPSYHNTYYCVEHFLRLNEPLFGDIPFLYCCPRGPGLREPSARPTRGKPFLMPGAQS